MTPKDLFHLILFIAEVHWRVPSQDQEHLEFIKSLNQQNSVIQIKNKITGKNAPKELFEKVISEPSFVENYKMLRAMENYLDIEKDETIKNWKIYFSPPNNNHPHLLSDNPVMINKKNESNILKSQLIFPLSKSKIVYHTFGKVLKEIPPENRVSTDILLFIQANKMVCGPDPDYLKTIAELASAYDNDRRIELLKDSIFNIFRLP